MKRAIKGTYIAIDPFHVFRFVDEEVFRFDHRDDTDAGHFLAIFPSITGKRLTYEALIGKNLLPL